MNETTSRYAFPEWARGLFQPQRYKAPHGGRGAGAKSRSVSAALVLIASKEPKRILCTREFQKTIKDSVHKLLKDQVGRMGLDHAFAITDASIRGLNGSEFIFAGLHANVASIKSLEDIDIVWVEEAETVSELSWQALLPTIRKPGSEIWVTFNPREEDDPTSIRFIKSPPPNCWAPFLKPGRCADNPWFTDELLAEMAHDFKVDPDTAAHVWNGEFRRNSEAQIFKGKTRVEEFDPAGAGWDGPWFGLDFGFSNDPLSAHKYWARGNTLYVEHECWGTKIELNDIPAALRRDLPGIGSKPIRADCARPESISHLQGLGINCVACKKWPGSVEDGVAYLRSLDGIVIHPRCRQAVREARLYSYKVDKLTGHVTSKILDAWNHFWDECRYALEDAIMTQERSGTVTYDERNLRPELVEMENAMEEASFSTFTL